jgi:uncharacterized protein (DUF1015 family)
MLYSDSGEIDSLLSIEAPPDIDLEDEYGVRHRVWRVADPSVTDLVRRKMKDKKLIIADGHHRYETALTYRNERRAEVAHQVAAFPRERSQGNVLLKEAEPELASYERVMMTFVNMNSGGLVILPTHRVVHSLPAFSIDEFVQEAKRHFEVKETDSAVDANRATSLLRDAGRFGTALLAITQNRTFVLQKSRANPSLFGGLSPRQQALDVVQLHKVVLETVLGLSEESIRNQENISYVRDAGEAISRVRGGGANVAFLMNPVRMEQVRDIAFAGEVLPQKSTDFYPKMLTGLTIYALD